jgi:hypothetical protein
VKIEDHPFFSRDAAPEDRCRAAAGRFASVGAVRVAGLSLDGRPHPLAGLRGQQVFGPEAPDRCACGRQVGAAAQVEACPRCGVACGGAEGWARRWAHLPLPAPLLHPAARRSGAQPWPSPAETLEEIDAGCAVFDDPMLAWALCSAVPLPPPGLRPWALAPQPGAELNTPSALDWAFDGLLRAALRLGQLMGLGAPAVFVRQARLGAQGALDHLWRVIHDDVGLVTAPLPRRGPSLPVPRGRAPGPSLAFDGRDRLIWSDGQGAGLLRLDGGPAEALSRLPGRIRYVRDGLAYVDALWVGAQGWPRLGGALFDLRARRWRRRWPPRMPWVVFDQDQPEDGDLVDLRRGIHRSAAVPSDRPAFAAYGPGGAAIWLRADERGGPVYAAELPQEAGLWLLSHSAAAHPAPTAPPVCPHGRRARALPELVERFGAEALAFAPGAGWRFLFADGGIGGGGLRPARLSRAARAAAWSAEGDRLAVWDRLGLAVCDVVDGVLVPLLSLGRPAASGRSAGITAPV